MRRILKKDILISVLYIMICLVDSSVYASDQQIKPIKLKSKCIKQNPLVANQTDQVLLGLYQQICDKPSVQQTNDLLAQAAMRMYELKQPMNALTLANQLQQQNVHGATLTDIVFLSSIEIANGALQHMKGEEMRYLSNDLTYPPAKQLSENIRIAQPAPDTSNIKAITDESLKKEMQQINNTRRISNKQRVQVIQPVRKVVNQTVNSKRQTTAPSGVNKQSNAVVQKTSASPFDALKQ